MISRSWDTNACLAANKRSSHWLRPGKSVSLPCRTFFAKVARSNESSWPSSDPSCPSCSVGDPDPNAGAAPAGLPDAPACAAGCTACPDPPLVDEDAEPAPEEKSSLVKTFLAAGLALSLSLSLSFWAWACLATSPSEGAGESCPCPGKQKHTPRANAPAASSCRFRGMSFSSGPWSTAGTQRLFQCSGSKEGHAMARRYSLGERVIRRRRDKRILRQRVTGANRSPCRTPLRA